MNIDEAPRPVSAVWRCEEVRFGWPGQPELLHIVEFALAPGERVLLHGRSGSGKSTLLNLAAGVVLPQSGRIELAGTDLTTLSASARDRLRADHLGVVFQQFNLLPYLDVRSNVLLGCQFSARRRADAANRSEADRLLAAFDLAPAQYAQRPVRALSVGQQQRVAAARALIGAPALVIADEPTSALDPQTRDQWLVHFLGEARRVGSAVLMVSHDPDVRVHFDRVMALEALQSGGPEP